jgi:CDP-glycerol glycerophosphotransferase
MRLLSFVIPTHNVEMYIEKCLGSILQAAGVDLEVIVVEDASTDATLAVLHHLADGDARVSIRAHRTPLGAGMSRNEGLAAASGDFVWFVDGDDWLFDGAVERVAERLDDTVDLLFVNYVRVLEGNRIVPATSTDLIREAPAHTFTLAQWPPIVRVLHVPWNKIVRRSLLNASSIEFPDGIGEDIVFTYRTLRAATAIEIEPVVCYAWRSGRQGQLTRTSGPQHLVVSEQWRLVLEAYADESLAVREEIFKRMIQHGWGVLANPFSLRGPLRRQFFRQFVALYRSQRSPGVSRNLVLGSGSWTLGRLRCLARRAKVGRRTW